MIWLAPSNSEETSPVSETPDADSKAGDGDFLKLPAEKSNYLRNIFSFFGFLSCIFLALFFFSFSTSEIRYNHIEPASFKGSQLSGFPDSLFTTQVKINIRSELDGLFKRVTGNLVTYRNSSNLDLTNVNSERTPIFNKGDNIGDAHIFTSLIDSLLQVGIYNNLEEHYQSLLSKEFYFGAAVIAAEEDVESRDLKFNVKTGNIMNDCISFYPPGIAEFSSDKQHTSLLSKGDIWFDLNGFSACQKLELRYLCEKPESRDMTCFANPNWVFKATQKIGIPNKLIRHGVFVALGILLVATVNVFRHTGLWKIYKILFIW